MISKAGLLSLIEVGAGERELQRLLKRDLSFFAEIYADPSLAHTLFGWRAEKTLEDMCADHWRWQRENPDGYRRADGSPPEKL